MATKYSKSPVSKFRFVSPGVFVDEVDNSKLPADNNQLGPVIIGRTERGPAMRPFTVNSYSEFVDTFGEPSPGGGGANADVWRDGSTALAPTYASYAAKAVLRNNIPVTVVRLLGEEHPQAEATGQAGWNTDSDAGPAATDGGAYGLLVMGPTAGTLAAVWYLDQGHIRLSGNLAGVGAVSSSSGVYTAIHTSSAGDHFEFRAILKDGTNAEETVIFNFNEDSDRYIRKVFNTNPTLSTSTITSTAQLTKYWLGETFERSLRDTFPDSASMLNLTGTIVALGASDTTWEDNQIPNQPSKTGWVFGQDLNPVTSSFHCENMPTLFRFVSLDTGEWSQKNLKISITDVKPSTSNFYQYGTFTVLIRKIDDTDNVIKAVERFTNCSLDPNSPNYIARKIGDMYMEWDNDELRYDVYGEYENNSKFIRVEMQQDVATGATDPRLLPFGFRGQPRFKTATLTDSGNDGAPTFANAYIKNSAGGAFYYTHAPATNAISGAIGASCAITFPRLPMRLSSSTGVRKNSDSFFGVQFGESSTSQAFEKSTYDVARNKPEGINSYDVVSTTEYSVLFSLDDLKTTGSTVNGNDPTDTIAVWASGSRFAGTSLTAVSGWSEILDRGFDSFTMNLYGGFDGLNIKQKEPFGHHVVNGRAEKTDYAYHTIKRAIDTVADPELVETNLICVPGVREANLTSYLIDVCEARADALALIDVEYGGYQPDTETTSSFQDRIDANDVDTCVNTLKARNLNTTYACTYYPWVRIVDSGPNGAGKIVWVPPSVVMAGTFAASETREGSELWFAPAGFTRGGLSANNVSGLTVSGVTRQLSSKERDKLYENNINPIAKFPAEGIVAFGQKTLTPVRSAVDRINVRRLMIYVKKEISRFAATILFDQNVQVTWARFISLAEPFLASIKARNGLVDFKVVLDETTTTPDLIDRNIMYAKIFLKPARAIEFIALDFVITRTGASFDD